jgi:hypothetical protein
LLKINPQVKKSKPDHNDGTWQATPNKGMQADALTRAADARR